jgi:hypothetical protein
VDRTLVGTGRCGSTLPSRMRAESSDVLAPSELFDGLDMTRRLGDAPARVAKLPAGARERLDAACRPGMRRLGRLEEAAA